MNKGNLFFGIVGLLVGLVVGFLATNSYNRSTLLAEIQSQNKPQTNQPQIQNAAVPEVAEAIERADKNPEDFQAQKKAGEMFYRIKNFELALPYFEKAHKAKPDDYPTIVMLGNLNFELRRFSEVEKWYEMALKQKPDDFIVRADLGLSFYQREPKNLDRALKEYKAALLIEPNHEPTLQNLAVAYWDLKDAENLKDTLAKLEKVNPNNKIIQKLRESN